MLVDDYKFAAYNDAGLGKIGEQAALAVKGTKNMKPPKLRLKTWWTYLRNVAKLAPIPKNSKIRSIPEGVTRLGATFGVAGNKMIYVYEDGNNNHSSLFLPIIHIYIEEIGSHLCLFSIYPDCHNLIWRFSCYRGSRGSS